MNKADIISFANKQGAYAVITNFDGEEIISIFVEEVETWNIYSAN